MPTPPRISGSVSAAISSAVVKLLREYTGRGPTKARTYMNSDLITVVLRDTLTMGERSLVRDGEVGLVLATRKAYQRTMANELIDAVEKHSGRRVIALLSDNHIDPDIAIESFVLLPQDGHDSSTPPGVALADGIRAMDGDGAASTDGHVGAGDDGADALPDGHQT
ncbi:MAG TPA: Na-translocating system protein MpsC family protein [Solirubrobacteraceae bacterium]|nr:Na-translocating system protein MpsC family protein [Solirubrobacteraceae bacterium]